MSGPPGISDSALLRLVLASTTVRIAVIDRTGRFILDHDPNPVRPGHGAPMGGNLLDMYGAVPGLSEAVIRAFTGEQVEFMRRHEGATYTTKFLPIRDGNEVNAVCVLTLEEMDKGDASALEQELTDMQAKERRLFNSDMVGLIYWRGDGAITDANDAFLAMVGYTRDDLLSGRVSWREMTPPEFHHLDDDALIQMQRTGRCEPFEKQYVRKDGRRIDIFLGAATFGAEMGGVAFVLDVTARKRDESEQEKLKAQLLQAQKLESLGLLAGGIAHDFNNILTPILGAASAALMTLPAGHAAREDIETVVAAARRAASLTRQMLAYSGKAQVEIRAIDLSVHVNEIASLLETSVPKKVKLKLDLQAKLPAVEADVAQVQQIAMNLVINGAEAIGEGEGTVRVTTGRQTIDDDYAATLFAAEGLRPGEYVFLEVHDNGHGMDELTQQKIFDPFFTTKFTGRGLGLAAVLGIVRAHRGAIKVYSSPGKGTTFKVFLPASRQTASSEAKRPTVGYRGEGLVLVIDDDPGVRRTAKTILEMFGFTVITAEDGLAGVELFAQRASDLTLVIVDMTMPRMSGEETFHGIRSIRSDVPVILTSGYNEIEATRRFTGKGLAGFLEKPFTPSDLAAKLASVLPSGAAKS